MYRWNRIAQLSALGACCTLAVWITSTNASQEDASVLVKKSATTLTQGPVLPPPSKPATTTKDVPVQQPSGATPDQVKPQTPPVQSPAKTTVKRPFMQPAQPREPGRGQLTTQSEPIPAPKGSPEAGPPARELNVHPAPPIVYDTDRDARKMYRSGQVQLVMITQDPADGCCYEIPMCIPACCTGEPKVSAGRGILGRGVVEYCWQCGFRAKVKFRHVRGDVRVDYDGD
jgi:hypothetical protein